MANVVLILQIFMTSVVSTRYSECTEAYWESETESDRIVPIIHFDFQLILT